ncbi:carboxylesterase family protein [Ketobacter sp. MCCC 1A13808]|uniref:carboxylesterase/lipase family protein n=1 Tax=Ketobacter sp. MCCC 1A13808 TaxID=2602738 RepID=UPI0012EC9857|nr:carboxylesterase family protein [Ketobacter sp. MCCC 1A13808]MVF11969.1 carboxylesterase family protein [Ketobacter sp. MCCC 1A13808]
MKTRPTKKQLRRSAIISLAVSPILLPLASCGGDKQLTGTFIDSAVSGLNFEGTTTEAGVTDSGGEFNYLKGETITFSIGDLELGSAEGAELMTPLTITEDATAATDSAVNNKLILLQSIDADGDLNNGIQITEMIRTAVSDSAAAINFDQPAEAFGSSLEPLLATLESNSAFSDTDPRARVVRDAPDAVAHFLRSSGERIVVATNAGDVRGFAANESTWQFLGIPYAKPPLGDLRWRPPVQPDPWVGVRDAVAWADQSAQNPTLEAVNEGGMSEDSLYLNVTAPKEAENLPVMVWFHGGSFAILSANSKQYNNPDSLTTKGVVLVTVNHRLGPFGYIAHPLLSEESGYGGSGNYGQMDLVMALQWVQQNIAAFGGNPGNVTLFGQSGGGGKTYSLMNSPQATGLFHKAIVQSGFAPLDTTSGPEDSLAGSEAIGSALFERAGVTTLEEARALPWTALVQADLENDIPRQTYVPNADFYYQPKTYYQNVMDGMPSDVPLMSGATAGDYDTLRAALPVWLTQRSPTYQSNQYVYKFSWVPDGWGAMGLASCHGCELPYVFNYPAGLVQNYVLGLVLTPEGEKPEIGDLNGNGVTGTEGDAADVFASMQYGAKDAAVTELTMTMWSNFAKTGNPATDDVMWPLYTNDNDTFVEIGPETGVSVKTGLKAALE